VFDSWPWSGEYTAVPAMGDDGSQWTQGYLAEGQSPIFKVYDASANMYYIATPSENYGFQDLGTWVIDSISVIDDCSGALGGLAFYDDCGTCSGGSSGHIENSDQDCQGVCFGDAYIDGCGQCVGGTTGNDACPLDCMGMLTPDDCSDSLTPGCATFDDCGTCVNGNSGNTFNQEADCLGECFGGAIYDECGVCDGNDSSCNQPIAYYQTVTMDEDGGSIVIALEASDPNGDELTYTLASSPNNGVLNGWSDSEFIYIPNENFNGQDSFSFTVTDGVWTSGVGVVTINVIPVNDAPVLDFIDTQYIDEDGAFILDLLASDVDFDTLDFLVSIDGNADVSLDGNDLVITPFENFNGEINVSVTVSDGSLEDHQDFVLIVNPVNDAPVLSPIANQTINEDETLSYVLDVFNVDNDMIFFNATVDDNFTAVFSNNTLHIAPDIDWSGSGLVIVSAFDGEYLSEQTFNLHVLAVNDAPVLSFIEDQEIDEDTSLIISLSGSEIDSDTLVFSV
jgi:hypothetical protein